MPEFRAPKGTYDVVPPLSAAWLAVREALAAPPRTAGYAFIETPTFEDTALFVRGVGESTDVVSKEMYTFEDRGGRSLTLRPEGTAGVMRAIVENGLDRGQLPVKVWYTGPNFRYERPQSGRYRQHTQVGVETVGSSDPALDAEVIWLAWSAYRALGLSRVRLLLNSIGDDVCRPAYRALLQEYLSGLDLDEATRQRAEVNPLRVLDDKRPEVQEQLVSAPLISEHLCDECAAYHDELRGYLELLGVEWQDEHRLVRGLDYYQRTLFEFAHDGLGAQSAIGGGGRYDGLLEMIGGQSLPGVGFGLGVDRTLLACQAEGVEPAPAGRVDVFLVPLGDDAKRLLVKTLAQLRDVGVRADLEYGGKGLKGAMKSADRSGAAYTVVLGERDLADGMAGVKDMASGDQQPVKLTELVETLKGRLS
jgi:histidyl-tRNA synthetase